MTHLQQVNNRVENGKTQKNRFRFVLMIITVITTTSCYNNEMIPFDNSDNIILSQNYIIAHRGSWNKDIPENSVGAFKKALELKIYGVEFDVRQTKDGCIVIHHDETYGGLKIDNSTLDELLLNKQSGGDTLPLLDDFLDIKSQLSSKVKLIVDVKNCIITDLVQQINNYSIMDEVVFISFNKGYCKQLVKLGYGANTYYSSNGITPTEIKNQGFGGVCYNHSFVEANLGVIEEAKSLNIPIMVWTVNNPNSVRDYCLKNIYVITDCPEEF